jgi:hypothetical protein
VAVVLLTGCRIEVVAELDLRDDGSGTAVLDLFLDRELLDLLDELDVDAVDEVEAAVEAADDWDLDIEVEGFEGLRLRLVHEGPDPAGALGELSAGLAPEDPGLRTDLRIELDQSDQGSDELGLAGIVELGAPHAPGAVDEDGGPLGPDRAELERLMRDHVASALVVTMPGTLQRHNADRAEEAVLVWDLPVDQQVEVAATSQVSPLPVSRELLLAGAGVLLVLALGGVVWVVRRRSA